MRLPTLLLQRKANTHKGDFGHILVVAGCRRFSGAGILSAEAALRSGAGLVTLALPQSLVDPVIRVKAKEIMLLPLPQTQEGTVSLAAYRETIKFIDNADIVALGPGMSRNSSTQSFIRKLILTCNKPLVIDADGINALAGHLDILRKRVQPTVLTPHPAEMARLLGCASAAVQKDRKKVAKEFATNYNSTTVLKGHHTVVASNLNKLYVNTTGNPGMATAGSGDVLTGIIAAFLGQGLSPFEAAKYAVYLHGMAGDLAAKQKTQISLIASDIIAALPMAIKICS